MRIQTYRTYFAGDHLIDVTYLDFPLAPRHPGTFLLLPHVKIMNIFEGLMFLKTREGMRPKNKLTTQTFHMVTQTTGSGEDPG